MVVLLLGGIWLYGYNYAKDKAEREIEKLVKKIEEMENRPIMVEPVTPEIVLSIVSSETSEISELASAEFIFTNAAKFTDTKGILGIFDWMTEKSFIQRWDGTIKAGVDLSGLRADVDDTVITITLPPAKILSYEIDYDSVEVLDEKNNVFNPISVEDRAAFDKETSEAMKARAIENGILEKAQENAEGIITNLLRASLDEGQEYTIEFEYTND